MWWQTWIFNFIFFQDYFNRKFKRTSGEQILIDIGLLVAYDF